ncbi:MAG: ATP-dependent metallopeptidase FtsH/Yme1/Tma family protein [Acidobacteria bacterium]|nr:MAG: ATP-dependent metallopeptidase FtsH/Yme1/Tma family protein [Acidobacteriota bacterium]
MHAIRLLLLSLFVAFGAAGCQTNETLEIPYSTLKQHIAKGDVREVRMSPTEVQATPTESARQAGAPALWIATPIPNDSIVPLLESKNITYQGIKSDESHVPLVLGVIAGLTFVLILGMSYKRMNPVKSMTSLTRGRLRARDKNVRARTGFDSVAGVDEAKEELEEIVKFLRSPARFASLGARVPKGALLIGPPGTGKTLLARAVAGEAGVPFFSASASEFIEVFVGVGASRVRKLFEQAKAKAPAIVFIDELDAIGKSRSGSHGGGGTDEREQTLNQLLVEMDGFDSRDGIIVLAATNRAEILDSALLRPGRFDRQVLVDRPDGTGRHAILRVHARKVKLANDVDLEYVARRTPGMVGADLENVLNEAALLAARHEKSEVGMPELHAAIDRVVVGLERKTRLTNTKERRIVAFHEAGHAIVAELAESAEPVHKVSIVPRGLAALGYMQQTPEDRNLLQEDELMDRLAVLLGGRAAEHIAFGKFSTGAANDLERATGLARRMICEFGMSPTMGPVTYQSNDGRGRRTGDSGSGDWSEDATERIEAEVQALLTRAFDSAVATLSRRRAVLDGMAEALLAQGSLEREEFLALLGEAA